MLIDATLKEIAPPLALPKREFMERARRIWDELDLPPLTPQPPWHGYSLGDWDAVSRGRLRRPRGRRKMGRDRQGDLRAPPRRAHAGDAGEEREGIKNNVHLSPLRGEREQQAAGQNMKDIRNIGVIGLGKMGMPMARLLRERGFTVTGYDVALPAVKAAASKGILPVNSPKAVAAASDLTIIAVGLIPKSRR